MTIEVTFADNTKVEASIVARDDEYALIRTNRNRYIVGDFDDDGFFEPFPGEFGGNCRTADREVNDNAMIDRMNREFMLNLTA